MTKASTANQDRAAFGSVNAVVDSPPSSAPSALVSPSVVEPPFHRRNTTMLPNVDTARKV